MSPSDPVRMAEAVFDAEVRSQRMQQSLGVFPADHAVLASRVRAEHDPDYVEALAYLDKFLSFEAD